MAEKPNDVTNEPAPEEIADLPDKEVPAEDAEKTKGGRRGPGTQTEDDIYVG